MILGKDSQEKSLDFSLFWKVWDILKEKYVDRDTLDAKKLLYGAINGMLSASGDPYTTFFDPEATKAFDEEIAGSFDGIGAEMGMKDKILTIIAPRRYACRESRIPSGRQSAEDRWRID